MYSVATVLLVSTAITLVAIQGIIEPVTSAWPSVVQTVLLAFIPVLALWVKAYLDRIDKKVDKVDEKIEKKTAIIEAKVDENSAVTYDTRLSVNSIIGTELDARIVDLKELLTVKPGDISVLARLNQVEKARAKHITDQAIIKDRAERKSNEVTQVPLGTEPIVAQKIEEPVEIKTK